MTDPIDGLTLKELDDMIDAFWKVLGNTAVSEGWRPPPMGPNVRERLRDLFGSLYRAGMLRGSQAGFVRVATPERFFEASGRADARIHVERKP